VFTSAQATTVALWILFAWVHDAAATHSPLLLVTSVEANSGKTTLLLLISYLTPRALVCVEISEATLFRGVELWQPTIIVDEADVILVNNEPLRAVVNSSWTRGSCVPRCIGDANVPHAFPTFCPKAIGMKGRKLHAEVVRLPSRPVLDPKDNDIKGAATGGFCNAAFQSLRREVCFSPMVPFHGAGCVARCSLRANHGRVLLLQAGTSCGRAARMALENGGRKEMLFQGGQASPQRRFSLLIRRQTI